MISLDLFKSKATTTTILDKHIKLDLSDIEETANHLNTLKSDLEQTLSALTFKNEKINKIKTSTDLTETKANFKNIQPQKWKQRENVKIHNIIEVHNDIEKMKNTYRAISLLREINQKSDKKENDEQKENEGNYKCLENLLANENEWLFLAQFVMAVKHEINYRQWFTKLEKSLIEEFEKEIKNITVFSKNGNEEETTKNKTDVPQKSIARLKKFVKIAKVLENEESLMKTLFFALPFMKNIKKEKIESDILDLEIQNTEPNSLSALMQQIETIIEPLSRIISIFSEPNTVFCKLYLFLCKNVFLPQVEYLTDTSGDFAEVESVWYASYCYNLIIDIKNKFCLYIDEPDASSLSCEELVLFFKNIYQHEIEALNLLISIIRKKTKNIRSLQIAGKDLAETKIDPVKSVVKIIYLCRKFMQRSQNFGYSHSEVKHYLHSINKQTNAIIESVNADSSFDSISYLDNIFCICHSYVFNVFNIEDMHDWIVNMITDKIKMYCDNEFKYYKEKICDLKFNGAKNEEKIETISIHISEQVKMIKSILTTTNGINLIKNLGLYVISLLKKQIKRYRFTQENADLTAQSLKTITNKYLDCNLADVNFKINTFYSLMNLLIFRKEDLPILIRTIEVNKEEIKEFLRCRMDYNQVVDVLEKTKLQKYVY